MSYISRVVERTLRRYLETFPVIGLTGPRQSGKSTLLQHMLPDYQYISFDDPKQVLLFSDDPEGFLNRCSTRAVFDEIQHVPDLFHHIKLRTDRSRSLYGNFILTGSAQFAFMRKVTESLAGRIGLVSLLPFQYQEMPAPLRHESVFRGAYPEPVTRNYHESMLWYASYIETYLGKDVRSLANIGDLHDFRRFMQLLAARTTQVLDMSVYARELGVSVPTVKRWLSVLEASYVIFIVPPFYNNFGKRITKSPKVYFYDTGIVSWFTGIDNFIQYDQGPMAGALFENYIVSEIAKKELHAATGSRLYYFRTQDKAEIDLIVDRKSGQDFIEIKKNATFHPRMVQTLQRFRAEGQKTLLLYQGEQQTYRGVNVLPYYEYLAG